ncbi:hypothetical protein B0H14DRAFT_3457782 [Mycena olivaceomarginata]|nr:hypothetical protein B0H14DRAFT_3457782 [Mycena olivaceomarginata]
MSPDYPARTDHGCYQFSTSSLSDSSNIEKRKLVSVREWAEFCAKDEFRAPGVRVDKDRSFLQSFHLHNDWLPQGTTATDYTPEFCAKLELFKIEPDAKRTRTVSASSLSHSRTHTHAHTPAQKLTLKLGLRLASLPSSALPPIAEGTFPCCLCIDPSPMGPSCVHDLPRCGVSSRPPVPALPPAASAPPPTPRLHPGAARDVVAPGTDPNTPLQADKPNLRVLKVIRKIEVEALCVQHNPVICLASTCPCALS